MIKTLKTILACTLLVLLGTAVPPLHAQGTRTVGGTVLDEHGDPLYGAFVIQQGTSNGVSTDLDGKYSLRVPAGEVVLEFQFIGYATQAVTVPAGQAVLNVTMNPDTNLMDEVVVTAFATQKKVNVTGAISSVN